MGSYREDVTQALNSSSMKGLPKIFSAPNLLHQILWTVAFILFLVVCILMASLNVLAYLGYPKIVKVEEKLMNPNDPNGTVPFPTIAVCNINQFGSNKSVFEKHGIPLPSDYYDAVHRLTACEGCSAHVTTFTDSMKRQLMTNRGYYQYVGKNAIAKIGNRSSVLICQALVGSGSGFVPYPCENLTTSYRFIHPDIGVCTAYEVLSHDIMVIGYTFTLHLDSSVDNVNTAFEPLLFPQPMSGAVFYALDPYIVPNMYSGVALAGPGQATTFHMEITRTDRLSTPYSERECINADENEKYQFQQRLYDYSYVTCISRCNVAFCEERCNCTDLFMQRSPEEGDPKYKYCGSVSQSAHDLYKNMYCVSEITGAASDKCTQKCKLSCKEIKYGLRMGTTKWPLPSQIGSFYANIIHNDPILFEKYSKYEEVANGMAAGSQNVSEIDKLIISKAIGDNFALVSIYLSDFYYTHYESKEKTPLNALLAQLGGSLNLWSGITAVLVVELIDLLLRILARMTGMEKSNPVDHETALEDNVCARENSANSDTKMDTLNI